MGRTSILGRNSQKISRKWRGGIGATKLGAIYPGHPRQVKFRSLTQGFASEARKVPDMSMTETVSRNTPAWLWLQNSQLTLLTLVMGAVLIQIRTKKRSPAAAELRFFFHD
jgi:hypothetical protein